MNAKVPTISDQALLGGGESEDFVGNWVFFCLAFFKSMCNELHMFKMYNLMSFDVCIHH